MFIKPIKYLLLDEAQDTGPAEFEFIFDIVYDFSQKFKNLNPQRHFHNKYCKKKLQS